MKKILVATGNAHKVEEIRQIFSEEYEILSMKDAGISCEIIEDGDSFRENAMIKAVEVKKYWDGTVIADDSGLVIDALDGQPGVHSARFMGEDTDYKIKCDRILNMLSGVPEEKRTARFVCAMAAILPDGEKIEVEGKVEGIISDEYVGENGFGYDPIFYVPKYGVTTAQMSPEQKNEISHRGNAIRLLEKRLTSDQN